MSRASADLGAFLVFVGVLAFGVGMAMTMPVRSSVPEAWTLPALMQRLWK